MILHRPHLQNHQLHSLSSSSHHISRHTNVVSVPVPLASVPVAQKLVQWRSLFNYLQRKKEAPAPETDKAPKTIDEHQQEQQLLPQQPTQQAPEQQQQQQQQQPRQQAPDRFAVFVCGGHQYKVAKGDVIITQKLQAEVGAHLVFSKVLLVGGRTFTAIGTPILTRAKVHAQVQEQTKAEKVIIFKKKRRKGYKRKTGHRQPITVLYITDISIDYTSIIPHLSQAK